FTSSCLLVFMFVPPLVVFFCFFHDTTPTDIYSLSLHDALPIFTGSWMRQSEMALPMTIPIIIGLVAMFFSAFLSAPLDLFSGFRSEEHTSELQSRFDIVCRLLLEKKKKRRLCARIIETRSRRRV